MTTEIKLDTSVLDRLLSVSADRAEAIVHEATLDLLADIKLSVSGPSPSSPGSPPGVVTGNLLNSIYAEMDGTVGYVNVGANYGLPLEFGTRFMEARPFVTPAMDRLAAQFSDYFEKFIE